LRNEILTGLNTKHAVQCPIDHRTKELGALLQIKLIIDSAKRTMGAVLGKDSVAMNVFRDGKLTL